MKHIVPYSCFKEHFLFYVVVCAQGEWTNPWLVSDYAVEGGSGVEVGRAVMHQRTDVFFVVKTDSILPIFGLVFFLNCLLPLL